MKPEDKIMAVDLVDWLNSDGIQPSEANRPGQLNLPYKLRGSKKGANP
jgi:hypothetical protein